MFSHKLYSVVLNDLQTSSFVLPINQNVFAGLHESYKETDSGSYY